MTGIVRRSRTAVSVTCATLLVLVAAAVPAQAQEGAPQSHATSRGHEIWMLDQGTDRIHVHDGRTHREKATIDVSWAALQAEGFERGNPDPAAPTMPHMIDFDSEYRYAFVAATSGASTIVIDARLKEVVAVLATGAGSHMAAVVPDDSAAWTGVIGAEEMVEIPLDLDAPDPSFEIGRVLSVPELLAPVEAENPDWRPFPAPEPDPGDFTYASYSPVCHQYSPDSTEAWIALGPGWHQGALFVLDLDTAEVTAAWNPTEVHANCGIAITEDRAVANWSGRVVEGADTAGEWYVFDRSSKEHLRTHSAARGSVAGLDVHGLRLTPDGSQYWQVNRGSNDALVIDAGSIDSPEFAAHELPDAVDAPDILDFAPDSSLVYISQRGPNPLTGAPHAAAGTTPGVRIIDAATFESVGLIEPPTVHGDAGEVLNDIHGVGVRPSEPGEHGRARADRARA
jgi:DNA-binding beta-propeller fold protein YncE